MPVIAQMSFCASFRSLRPNRLIHINTAAIGWRKIESRISSNIFTLLAPACSAPMTVDAHDAVGFDENLGRKSPSARESFSSDARCRAPVGGNVGPDFIGGSMLGA